jgi:NAD-dependent aldehyde dehydrogenases
VQALRFVDVLPALEDDAGIAEHLRAYFRDADSHPGGAVQSVLKYLHGPAGDKIIGVAVRAILRRIARRFIGGGDAREALDTSARLAARGLRISLDLLGEAAVNEQEAKNYQQQYLALLASLEGYSGHRSGLTSSLPPGLSIKLSSLYSQMNPLAPQESAEIIATRLLPILRQARVCGVPVCIDMEQYDYKEIILFAFRRVLMEPALCDWPDAGIALQAYLRDTEQDIRSLINWARERGAPVTVRLVRGAYWDHETIIARQNGWPVPVWTCKQETDASYEQCLRLMLEGYPYVQLAAATHNVRSFALAHVLAEEAGLAADRIEYQMLYGMAPELEQSVLTLGHPLRIYLPYGKLIPGMAYLTRRLLENSSNQSFLRLIGMEMKPEAELLAPPGPPARAGEHIPGIDAFHNEPPRRFTQAAERGHFAASIQRMSAESNRDYPLLIDGQEISTHQWINSLNPARPGERVGRVAVAGQSQAELAVDSARRALAGWAARNQAERSGFLLHAARLMRERRNDFAALEILEAGKTWREADTDVTEAIDLINYYAREALQLAKKRGRDVQGETNEWLYQPRGVGAIIPPWNFPLAITCGMLTAAIVTGNTAILKPSSLTPVIAARFVLLLCEAGIPGGVVQFLPGSGDITGDCLVRHPEVDFIAFTGSLETGSGIIRRAAELSENQTHFKHVIAEMGGKNAIIVDADADLDDAVPGVMHSAFGYQGQKCSACSRVIVVGGQYGRFLERLIEATRSQRIGDPQEPATMIGPVISAAACERIGKVIEQGKKVAELVFQMDCGGGKGYFVGPAIFSRVPPDSFLAQEEIFGPVLSVLPARNFSTALAIANHSKYALTGGVYTRHPAHIEQARSEFHAGNLYFNRKITGAITGRQPFGGFHLSGLGSKAGGPDYLLHFVLPRTITENTLRRGYAPPL